MAWFDNLYGSLEFINPLIHAVARTKRTKARNATARSNSGAVRISIPHPETPLGKQLCCPNRAEVMQHLTRNGVRVWRSNYNAKWLYLVVRKSQETQTKWLLSNKLIVTSRGQLRSFKKKWK